MLRCIFFTGWFCVLAATFVGCAPITSSGEDSNSGIVSLSGTWFRFPSGAPPPNLLAAELENGTPVSLPSVVAEFIEDPAGEWQCFCRALPADFAERVRGGEAVAWHPGHASDVSRFYVNNVFIHGIGQAPPKYEAGHMRTRILPIPHTALRPGGGDVLCIALWSAGGFRAGVRKPGMEIGPLPAIYNEHASRRSLTLILLSVYLITGAYHLYLFLTGRRVRYDLYFGLLCVLVSLYFFLASPAFRDVFAGPWAVERLKLEFLFLTCLPPLVLAFIEQYLTGKHPPLLRWFLFAALLPVPPILIGGVQTVHYTLYGIHVIMLSTFAYASVRIVYEAWGGHRDARILLAGAAVLLGAVIHDVLVSHLLLPTPPIAQIAFAFLLPAVAVLLARRVHIIYRDVEAMNRSLEQRVRERTMDLEHEKLRAEASSRAKSRFLAAMSHEIRTPLQAMLGAAELIIASGEESEDRRGYAGMLERAGRSLSVLIEDTLDLARIEADRIVPAERVYDLREVLRSPAEMLSLKARNKGIALRVSIDGDLPRYALGDPGRISQILINLLGNAVKFTDAGYVAYSCSLRGQAGAEQKLLVEVEDTGPGIPGDKIENIFEAFEQADEFLARRHEGAGLGLAISRRLAELMQGSLSAESEVGRGSVFRLELPLRPAVASEAELPASPPEASSTGNDDPTSRILIAEDNEDIRMLLEVFLRDSPWTADFAVHGCEALLKMKATSYQLIILDVQMPVMDGLRTTRIFRRWERRVFRGSRALPIIALTAHAMETERDEILAAGFDSLLPKPVTRRAFLDAIRSALEG